MRPPAFKDLHHDGKFAVAEDYWNIAPKPVVTDGPDRQAIFGIDEHELLDKEQADNLLLLFAEASRRRPLIDGDARVAALENAEDGFEVELRLRFDRFSLLPDVDFLLDFSFLDS